MAENKKIKKIAKIFLSICLILVVVVNVLLNVFEGHVNLYLGRGNLVVSQAEGTESWDSLYYKPEYQTQEDVQKAASVMVETLSEEGFVLLKNNGTLPLRMNAQVTLLGRNSADPVFGGSGSGSVKLDTVVNIRDGLLHAGFGVNETAYDILEDYASYDMTTDQFGGKKRAYHNPKADIVMDKPSASTYYIGEMPVEKYTQDVIMSFSDYQDAAIISIGRGGGEGGDLTQDMKGWDDNYEQGQHQLELNQDEKDLIAFAKKHFNQIIVVINASSIMQLGELESDPEVDAIVWVGSPGQTGFNALGKILNGTVNPSGRTADIYPSDFTKDPTFSNFGDFQYSNISKRNATGDAYFVHYKEGIYIGYRYYETAAVEGFIDYEDAVVYPFGHGLSYTSFDWDVLKADLRGDDLSFEVKVTNTGTTSGKEVVQLYYSAPYYRGGIEKSEVVLGDFAKTTLLYPKESETLILTIPVESMASYDYKNERSYVLEAGEYELRLQVNSHQLKEGVEPYIFEVDETIVYSGDNHRKSDFSQVTNQFDEINSYFADLPEEGKILNMSRSNFEETFPTTPSKLDTKADKTILAGFQPYIAKDHQNPEDIMPVSDQQNGFQLIDFRGVPYDDPAWDMLLDQLKIQEIIDVVMDSAYNTKLMKSVGKPATVELDGPAGIGAFMGDINGIAYPSAVVIASTFNVALVKELGTMVGEEGLNLGVNGWYAPGVNLHRSPFAGRNFEYYSEDPVLSGKIGIACVEGAADRGMYTFVKHYALNDQETNRINNGVASWANEQAIRELYLKPFEMIIKDSRTNLLYHKDDSGTLVSKEVKGATALMSSFNRIGTTWAGGHYGLMETVLRGEWDFEGFVISDFNLYEYMYPNQGIMAGTDVNITFASMKSIEDTTSPTAVNHLRKSAHRLLYTVANSSAMNGIVPGTTIKYTIATWKKVQIAANIIIGIGIIAYIFYIVKKKRKQS